MKLTWFGHAAVRAENGSHVILIDPFLSGNPKFNGSVEEATRGATHVVLTHGHDDHVGDAASICKNTGATLVAVYELAMYRRRAKALPRSSRATREAPSNLAAARA